MTGYCVSRGMSWDNVNYLMKRHGITFEQVPVAGEKLWEELFKVSKLYKGK